MISGEGQARAGDIACGFSLGANRGLPAAEKQSKNMSCSVQTHIRARNPSYLRHERLGSQDDGDKRIDRVWQSIALWKTRLRRARPGRNNLPGLSLKKRNKRFQAVRLKPRAFPLTGTGGGYLQIGCLTPAAQRAGKIGLTNVSRFDFTDKLRRRKPCLMRFQEESAFLRHCCFQ